MNDSRAECQRILDAAARRILREKLEKATAEEAPREEEPSGIAKAA